MASAQKTGRPVVGWVATSLSVVLLGASVALFAAAQQRSVSDEQVAESMAERELLEARNTLELATLEVIAVRMLDGVGVEGDRSARLSAAAQAARTATAEISGLAEGEGLVAVEAAVLFDDLDLEALEDPAAGDLRDLFAIAEDVARYSGVDDVVTTQRDAIQQLSFVSALPFHALIEGIAGDTSVNNRTVDPDVAPFVKHATNVVRTEGGWFGSDPAAPLDDSTWIEIDDARELLPTATESLATLIAASDLVEFDAWMRGLGDGNAAPPFELAEMLVAVDQLQPDLVAAIDQLFVDDEIARASELADLQRSRDALLIGAAATGFVALLGLVLGLWSIARATREARERAGLAMRDALTGIGNRHELEERTRHLAMDPRFQHHAVFMIDFDRFKIVNDVHGHAAGDAILVEVASRLQRIVERIEGERPGMEATAIRLGGDEFLLTAHATDVLDTDRIQSELDAIRGDGTVFNGERLGLGFSIGIAVAEGPNDLDGLMSAADLAVYDDKAKRAQIFEQQRDLQR